MILGAVNKFYRISIIFHANTCILLKNEYICLFIWIESMFEECLNIVSCACQWVLAHQILLCIYITTESECCGTLHRQKNVVHFENVHRIHFTLFRYFLCVFCLVVVAVVLGNLIIFFPSKKGPFHLYYIYTSTTLFGHFGQRLLVMMLLFQMLCEYDQVKCSMLLTMCASETIFIQTFRG